MTGTWEHIPSGIADATLLAVHEHGVEDLTFEHVARHAGVPLPEVARLAPTPGALAGAAMEQSYEDWRDQVPAWLPIPEGGSLAEGLTTILRDTFRDLKDPDFLRLGHLLMLQPHENPATRWQPADRTGDPGEPGPRETVLAFRARPRPSSPRGSATPSTATRRSVPSRRAPTGCAPASCCSPSTAS